MLSFAIMATIRFARLRALLLLMAFSLSFGGQVIAGVAMAAQTVPTAATTASAVSECPGCDGTAGMAPQCAIVFCSNVPVIPTQGAIFEPPPATISLSAFYSIGSGISSRPDPYPPRRLLA